MRPEWSSNGSVAHEYMRGCFKVWVYVSRGVFGKARGNSLRPGSPSARLWAGVGVRNIEDAIIRCT